MVQVSRRKFLASSTAAALLSATAATLGQSVRHQACACFVYAL